MTSLKAELMWVLFKLKRALKQGVDRPTYRRRKATFKRQCREIGDRTPREKGVLAFHRMHLIVGVALYRTLESEFQDREELIQKIHEILWNGPFRMMVRIQAFFVRRSKDPFERFLRLLGPKNEWFFPCPPWEKVSVEIEDGTGWHQTKCPYNDTLRREGAIELACAFCDMDFRIAELLAEHVELRREHRLAAGDAWCDFLYYRKSPVRA